MNDENNVVEEKSVFKTKLTKALAFIAVSYLLGALLHPAGMNKAITALMTAPLAAVAFTAERLPQLGLAMLLLYWVAKILRRLPSYWSLLLQGSILVAIFSFGAR